jgi:hypothetical protein
MDADERTIPMLSSDDRVAVRGIEIGWEVQQSDQPAKAAHGFSFGFKSVGHESGSGCH